MAELDIPSSARSSQSVSTEMDSREDALRRKLLERRLAKATPVPPPSTDAGPSGSNGSGGGMPSISIKGKGKGKEKEEAFSEPVNTPLKDRISGMRAWNEVPAADSAGLEIITREDRNKAEKPELDDTSSLAYPRSPSPRRSRSPRRRYGDRDQFPRPRHNERSRDRSHSPSPHCSPSPRREYRYERSPPPHRARAARDDSRTPPPGQIRNRSPPPPRRTFDNPDRLAMRQAQIHALPPNTHLNSAGRSAPIQAEPMRGPDQRERRPSPSCKPYERPPHLHGPPGGAPMGTGANGSGAPGGGYGYGPGRRDLGMGGQGVQGGQGGQGGGGWQNPPRRHNGPVDFEQRRLQREKSTLIVWPASPPHPYRDEEEIEADRRAAKAASKSKSKSKSHKSKKHHRSRYSSASSSNSSDSDDDRRPRHRKRDKRRKYASSDPETDSDEAEKRRRRSRKSKSKSKSRARSLAAEEEEEELGEEEWLEKKRKGDGPMSFEDLKRIQQIRKEEEEEIGPVLPGGATKVAPKLRYADMLPGEAEAMELYASNGMRIPRRGEIGIDTERIQNLEDSGYVMSGARHKKMNAMRLRKENQVINAEEKRAILNLQREEKIMKEGMIVSQFRELMNTAVQRGS